MQETDGENENKEQQNKDEKMNKGNRIVNMDESFCMDATITEAISSVNQIIDSAYIVMLIPIDFFARGFISLIVLIWICISPHFSSYINIKDFHFS